MAVWLDLAHCGYTIDPGPPLLPGRRHKWESSPVVGEVSSLNKHVAGVEKANTSLRGLFHGTAESRKEQ